MLTFSCLKNRTKLDLVWLYLTTDEHSKECYTCTVQQTASLSPQLPCPLSFPVPAASLSPQLKLFHLSLAWAFLLINTVTYLNTNTDGNYVA